MGLRQKEWATKKRLELKLMLGNRCAVCKRTTTSKKFPLEFDCIHPQGDEHHKMDSSARASFYFKQFREFNLQLLCKSCHIKKTSQERDNNPF